MTDTAIVGSHVLMKRKCNLCAVFAFSGLYQAYAGCLSNDLSDVNDHELLCHYWCSKGAWHVCGEGTVKCLGLIVGVSFTGLTPFPGP